MNTHSLAQLAWPAARLAEAVEAIGQACGAPGKGGPGVDSALSGRTPAASVLRDPAALRGWIDLAAARLGLEAEPVDATYAEASRLLCEAGPAIVRLPGEGEPSFLALLCGGGRRLRLLGPDGTVHKVPLEEVRSALCLEIETPISAEVDRVLDEAQIHGKRRARARKALLRELLPASRISGAWMVRPAGTAALRFQARDGRLRRLLVSFLLALMLLQLLWVGAWWLLGRGALEGRLDTGWLAAWALMLASWIPLELAATWTSGLLSFRAGALLKRRLLAGALQLQTEDIRHLGSGGLLGRVIESGVVEQMSVTGAFLLASAVFELSLAGLVLACGAGGVLHVALLGGWLGLAAWLGARYWARLRDWTRVRLEMTNDVVERMVGHRTRLAQEAPERWHEGEDEALDSYVALSLRLDRAALVIQALLPRGWTILGLLGLAPAFIFGGKSLASFAVGIGGMLLGSQAFRHLADGLERSLAALVAWRWVRPFWDAAARTEPLGEPEFAWPAKAARTAAGDSSEDRGGTVPILDLREVTFRHRTRTEPVLKKVDLKVWAGDRILLEGPSGGGKSTLASLLSGARNVGSGLLLLRGLDREVVGKDGWRRTVVLVPQFHENHVFLGSFAFNALMGRGWPPSMEDFQEAERTCRALGLGPLLERMPGGLFQSVGETGWQLSHGERSRLYIARALLQGGEVTILDESFAALDPETLRQNLGFVLEKASTLVVIAHP